MAISFGAFSKVVRDMFTEPDGISWDVMRVLLVTGCFSTIVIALVSAFKSGSFSAADFGAGYGGLMAAGGAGMGVRAKFEKKPEIQPAPEEVK